MSNAAPEPQADKIVHHTSAPVSLDEDALTEKVRETLTKVEFVTCDHGDGLVECPCNGFDYAVPSELDVLVPEVVALVSAEVAAASAAKDAKIERLLAWVDGLNYHLGNLQGVTHEYKAARDEAVAALGRVRDETLNEAEAALAGTFSGDDYQENAESAAGEGEWSWFQWLATQTVRSLRSTDTAGGK